jgi:hypothetical protein
VLPPLSPERGEGINIISEVKMIIRVIFSLAMSILVILAAISALDYFLNISNNRRILFLIILILFCIICWSAFVWKKWRIDKK